MRNGKGNTVQNKLYVSQNLYALSDEGTVAEVIDSRAFSDFCGVESGNQVPAGDTLGRFWNLLIRSGIQEKLFAKVAGLFQGRGSLLKKGTIVDWMLISIPTSTKNRENGETPGTLAARRMLVPRSAKPDRQTEYGVCFGKSDSG